jgi:hypothetical protein
MKRHASNAVHAAVLDLADASSPAVASSGTRRDAATRVSARLLKASATAWFVVAVLGQLIFMVYVLGFYGSAALRGDFAAWGKVMPHGYVAGDTIGNLIVVVHIAFVSLVILGGALQLVPAIRRAAPAFHRWNGRVYLVSTLVMSVGGLLMVWTRGAVGDLSQNIAINLNAFVIIACAVLAYRHARARRIEIHRRWALRLFMAVSGVWFFRVGLMFWILVNQGPAGFDPKTFEGRALTTLAFAQFLLPLAILELYLRAQRSGGARAQVSVATIIAAMTLVTAVGIAAATMIMWLPRL